MKTYKNFFSGFGSLFDELVYKTPAVSDGGSQKGILSYLSGGYAIFTYCGG